MNSSLNSFKFNYAPCATPVITSLSPRWITVDTDVVITGTGFSGENGQNSVKLGTHECNVRSSTNSVITCRIDTTNSPPVNKHLKVSLHVNNRGYALVATSSPVNETVRLHPIVTSITPNEGSAAGGTKVHIQGSGFKGDSAIVTIGLIECKITKITYSSIHCVTGKVSELKSYTWTLAARINGDNAICNDTVGSCNFRYDADKTPMVFAVRNRTISAVQTLDFIGSRFASQTSNLVISIGPTTCNATTVNDTFARCMIQGVVAGEHTSHFYVHPIGNAWFNVSDKLQGLAAVSSVSPDRGSVHGGTTISISGNGFDPTYGRVTVTIGGNACLVQSVSFSSIVCRTSQGSGARRRRSLSGTKNVVVKSGAVSFPAVTYTFDSSVSPTVTGLSPSHGHSGQTLTITGSNFDSLASNLNVKVGTSDCSITSSSASSIQCTLQSHYAGSVPVVVHAKGKGNSNNDIKFNYDLVLTSVSPSESGFGGGRNVTIIGYGFSPNDSISICNKSCDVFKASVSDTQISCESPSLANANSVSDVTCSMDVVTKNGVKGSLAGSYVYRLAQTSRITSISPKRGGTGGGVRVTITGTALSSSSGSTVVSIAGNPCAVQSITATEIVCITGPSKQTIKTHARVDVGTNGKALPGNATFFYVDVWSSKFSWGGQDPPAAGSL